MSVALIASNRMTVQDRLRLIRAHEDAIWEEFQRRVRSSGGYASDTFSGIEDAATQRILDEKLQDLSLGRNVVMYVGPGIPCIMVHVKGETLDYLGLVPGDTHLHPAFNVAGTPIPQLYIAKYQAHAITIGTTTPVTYAASLRGRDPTAARTFDEAAQYCANNNAPGEKGWHMMTNAEWAFLAAWAARNEFWPRGNNSYGKDYLRTDEYGEATHFYLDDGRAGRVACGSGPRYTPFWAHDGTPMGVWDLNGNVWEWVRGLRLQDGEIQITPDNDAADHTLDLSAASAEWKAILQDGSLVAPGTAGTLKWDSPNPLTDDGTTQDRGAPILRTALTNPPDPLWAWGDGAYDYNTGVFQSLTADGGVTVPDRLKILGLFPYQADHGGDQLYMRNYGERLPLRGGAFSNSSGAGVFALNLNNVRGNRLVSIGFRPAYVPGI